MPEGEHRQSGKKERSRSRGDATQASRHEGTRAQASHISRAGSARGSAEPLTNRKGRHASASCDAGSQPPPPNPHPHQPEA